MSEENAGTGMSRRKFLRVLGTGAGCAAVAGAAGMTWYSVDRGVFGTGTGPAYAAWDDWNPASGGPAGLVSAAVLAANAHNAQPWLFRVGGERIDLFADTGRSIGALDPLRREMYLSLGCALENLAVAAPAGGRAATVTLMPDPSDPAYAARVDLVPAPAVRTPLLDAVPRRHTDRAAYRSRPVPADLLDTLTGLVRDPGVEVTWFTGAVDRAAFADLTLRATRAIVADTAQSVDDFAWYRRDWRETQRRGDGITIDASGQSPVIRTVVKLVGMSRGQNNDGWLRATRDVQLPTAAAFGALTVVDPLDPASRLSAGRAWQRMHLSATAHGLSMQPLCQVPERMDRERSAGLPPDIGRAFEALLPGGRHPVMTFRIGYPTVAPLRSPRRPVPAVLLAKP